MTDEDGNARGLPSGLVTFVFTDIEGSTRLYKALGEEAAADVFDLHSEVLRTAIVPYGGQVVHTEGDSFFIVFEQTTDAVKACVEAQAQLAATDWPSHGAIRVRMGIHCGLAAPRNDDYMSLAVHQASRVMAAAHGGQILITDIAARRLDPVGGCSITRLGQFRLRDFDEAPVLLRADAAGCPVVTTPPRATPAHRHNLVPRLTSFIGRRSDVVAVNGLLMAGQAVTLVGPGGIGKTRLATEVGLEVTGSWPGGVWLVELAEVDDPALVVQEIGASIGAATGGLADPWHEILEHIGDRHTLIILDNLEHQIKVCAGLVPDLLRSCPNTAVLGTSREPLNCAAEVVYRLQPLDLGTDGAEPTSVAAVELFIDRARTVAAGFGWSEQAIAQVVQICRHLDGLPLAIEIAAAQLAVLQLGEIHDGLDNQFRLMRSRDRSLPARHRTMEGLLDWSHQLLRDDEQCALRRLAVFAGSFSIGAAEAALAGDGIDEHDVAELVWALVDKSLIAADLSDSATRYRLFESVQQYAMRLLVEQDDPVRIGRALGHWLLERIGPWRVIDRRWLGELATELANVRGVVDLIGPAEPELAQQLMCSVGLYHDRVQSYQVGVEMLTRSAATLVHDCADRVGLLATLAELQLRTGDDTSAAKNLADAAALAERVGPPPWNDAVLDRVYGEMANRRGEYATAIRLATDALARDLSLRGQASMWTVLGIARSTGGDYHGGVEALGRALTIYEELDSISHIGVAHSNLAEAAWRLGDHRKAARHQRECLATAITIGQPVVIAYSLFMASRLAGSAGNHEDAVLAQACAEVLVRSAGHELYDDDLKANASMRQRAEAELGAARVVEITQAGGRLDAMEAVELARSIFATANAPGQVCTARAET